MSLMRGPAEEVIEEASVEGDRFLMKALPALPSEEMSMTMQAFGLDISKEENGQFKMAPHESSQVNPNALEEISESTPEESEKTEKTGEVEQPMTLVTLFFSNRTRLLKV